MLDADVLIDLWRQYPPVVAWFAGETVRPALAALAALELLDGCRSLTDRCGEVDARLRSYPGHG